VGAGFAYPISATRVSFNGDYGVRLTQATFGSEVDFVGQFNATGPAQTLAGTLDVNTGFVNPGPTLITGAFKPGSHANVLSGTLSNNPDQFLLSNASGAGINVDYYLIDSSHGFLIETDLNDPINTSASVAFGYFAARTPVCKGCP
jgi:hypothetical protein